MAQVFHFVVEGTSTSVDRNTWCPARELGAHVLCSAQKVIVIVGGRGGAPAISAQLWSAGVPGSLEAVGGVVLPCP